MSRKPDPAGAERRPSTILSSLKVLSLVVLVAAVPLALREAELDPEKVRLAGRIAGGVGLVMVLYGLIKHLAKIALALAIALLAFAILVAEGVIDLPRLTGP